MRNLEWIRTLSAEELADWVYDEWLPRLQYRWSSSRGGLIIWLKDHKDEPQTNADQHVQHIGNVGSIEPTWTKEDHEAFYTFLWNVINPNEMQDYIGMFETKDEPQTDCHWK